MNKEVHLLERLLATLVSFEIVPDPARIPEIKTAVHAVVILGYLENQVAHLAKFFNWPHRSLK